MSGVADGHCYRIARVFGFELGFQAKQRMHHHFHLLLFGAAIAHHAGLDLKRRIFSHRQTSFGDSEQNHAAHMRKLQSRLDILSVKHCFDGGRIRRVRSNYLTQPLRDHKQPGFERLLGTGMDGACGDHVVGTAVA